MLPTFPQLLGYINYMKEIKVMWNGKHLRDIYPHATRFQVFKFRLKRFLRKVGILVGVTVLVVTVFELGGVLNPTLSYQTVEAIKEVETVSPVLQRIAGCESEGNSKAKGRQFDTNGQVLMRSNVNRSVDVGKYQINTVWFAKATELGYDITTEQGNEAMAMWIYKNRGTGDWYSSANCWKQ